jgi:hypothetical protein
MGVDSENHIPFIEHPSKGKGFFPPCSASNSDFPPSSLSSHSSAKPEVKVLLSHRFEHNDRIKITKDRVRCDQHIAMDPAVATSCPAHTDSTKPTGQISPCVTNPTEALLLKWQQFSKSVGKICCILVSPGPDKSIFVAGTSTPHAQVNNYYMILHR